MMADTWWAMREYETAAHWATRILCDFRTNQQIADVVAEAREAEYAWLRESMKDDGIPAHLQALVLEQWRGEAGDLLSDRSW